MKTMEKPGAVTAGGDWSSQRFVRGLMESNSPCAIVNRMGMVTSANPTLTLLVPDCVGRPVQDTFQYYAPTQPNKRAAGKLPVPADVLYYDTRGELIPACLHTLGESTETGERLLLLADGAPLRCASRRQLDAAPLAVMRVCADGFVRFANAETYRALSREPDEILGATLISLFGKTGADCANCAEDDKLFAGRLKACFDDCLKTLMPVSLDVWVGQHTNGERETAQMRLIPDLAPDGRALGVLAVIELTLEDRVRAKIGEIARDASLTWQQRLGLVLEQVRRLIKFRHANFGMYADEMTRFRAFALYPSDRFKWNERWLKLPAGIREWAESRETFVDDTLDFLKKFPEFEQSEVVRMYREQGIRSSVSLVAKDDHGPTSALSLCSTKVGRYSQRDVETLRNLNLEPVLIRIEEQILRQRVSIAADLKTRLANAKDISEVACQSVDELARVFQWDYVSLYRVDRQNNQFQLFYESKCPKDFCIERGYSQPLEDGMLGQCLQHGEELDQRVQRGETLGDNPKREETLVVNDVGNPDENQYNYIGLERDVVRSAMTIPLRLNNRIRWMLHVESHEAQAFHGPDLDSITQVVALLEEGLRQRAILEFNHKIMDLTRQGVVMVGMEGAILYVNEAASRLLGLKREQKPERPLLSDYASKDDQTSQEILSGFASMERRRVELEGEDGRIRPVLATRRALDGSFDTAIWFLIDLQAREWEVGMRFLRATVADVAQQTRAPIALASNIARQLPQLCCAAQPLANGTQAGSIAEQQSNADVLSKRLLAELKKADITFERLAKGLEIRRYPLRRAMCAPFDMVQRVNSAVDALPARDVKVIQVESARAAFLVEGDGERLDFVIRSLVAHMLRVRADEQHVLITLAATDPYVHLSFGLTDADEPLLTDRGKRDHDVIWRAFRMAREDACLGLAAVKRVVTAHGGEMKTRATAWANDDAAPPWIAFNIFLPAMPGGGRP